MKNAIIIGALVILGLAGLVLGLYGYKIGNAGDFSLGYFSAGMFSAGVFSAGMFSVGIFSVGLFSVGVFSLSVFNVAVYGLGFFIIAWKKHYAKVNVVEEKEK
mgnify:CR=1 FL=1